jgi:hypothetical protein
MPSEAVTLVATIAAPSIAGVVAVVIHRQRLAHERREADRAALRGLLLDGSRRVFALLELGVVAPRRAAPGLGQRDALLRELGEGTDWLMAFAGELRVWLPDTHPLFAPLQAAVAAGSQLERAVLEEDEDIEHRGDELADALGQWLNAAQKTVGTVDL